MEKSRRKELLESYKQMDTYMGVYQIKNNTNGKIFIKSFANLKSKRLTEKMQLDMGRHPNSGLQRDWNELGADAFTYEVLEEKKQEPDMDIKWELQQMEKAWLEKLQPYGDRGYNKPPKESQAKR
jgi:hypothetical protein